MPASGFHSSLFSAIQMTEVYEYAISLSSNNTSKSVLHSFQSLKYLYATWLVDYGLITQAFAYLEQIATVVLQEPHQYHKTLISRLTGLALRLQLHDQQRQNFTEEGNSLSFNSPRKALSNRVHILIELIKLVRRLN